MYPASLGIKWSSLSWGPFRRAVAALYGTSGLPNQRFNLQSQLLSIICKPYSNVCTRPRMRSRTCCWNPDDAVQFAVASEDDRFPVVQVCRAGSYLIELCHSMQLWDLRSAYSPIKELTGHTRGILSMDWCTWDSSMLITTAKVRSTLLLFFTNMIAGQ